jgi:hypothetical protein
MSGMNPEFVSLILLMFFLSKFARTNGCGSHT